MEGKFLTSDIRQVWEGSNRLTGRPQKKDDNCVSESCINDLNIFYGRFDTVEGKTGCDD